MPHLGSERPDEDGLRLIEQWIAGMNGDSAPNESSSSSSTNQVALSDSRAAQVVARRLGRAELKADEKSAVLTAAADLPAGPVRDLFEGYLPVDPHNRKLGSNPRPKSILSLTGDGQRGEALFWSLAVNCGTCHRIGDRGGAVGPDLSTIGKQRSREDLLESLLEPSRRIEPQFAAFLARKTDGSIVTGVVVKRDQHGAILRDAKNNEIVLRADEIDQLQPSVKSLMPDGQMAGLTAQQAADLLEYLASRR